MREHAELRELRTLSGLSHLIGSADSADEIALFEREEGVGMYGISLFSVRCFFEGFSQIVFTIFLFFQLSIEIEMGCVSDAR